MYVKYYAGMRHHIYVDEFAYGFDIGMKMYRSECQWIIPGTVDPRDD